MDPIEAEMETLLDGAASRADEVLRAGASGMLSPEYLAALQEIEALPCNRTGQDKSWVLRVARRAREVLEESIRLT